MPHCQKISQCNINAPSICERKVRVRKSRAPIVNVMDVNDLFALVILLSNFHNDSFLNSLQILFPLIHFATSQTSICKLHRIRICVVVTISFTTPEPELAPPHQEEDTFYGALSYQTPISTPTASPPNVSSASNPIAHPERTTGNAERKKKQKPMNSAMDASSLTIWRKGTYFSTRVNDPERHQVQLSGCTISNGTAEAQL